MSFFPNLFKPVIPTTVSQEGAATAWSAITSAIDVNTETYAYVAPAGATANTIVFSGFDFAFLGDEEEVINFTFAVKDWNNLTTGTITVQLYDGGTLLATLVEGIRSATTILFSTATTITKAQATSSSFAVKLSTTSYHKKIYSVYATCRGRAIALPSSNYGVVLRDAAGNSKLGPYSTTSRLVASYSLENSYSGTLSVPGFSDRKGIFTVAWNSEKFRIDTDAQLAPNTSWFYNPYVTLKSDPTDLPTLVWDEGTKTMTITPNPTNWATTYGVNTTRYHINFYHYR